MTHVTGAVQREQKTGCRWRSCFAMRTIMVHDALVVARWSRETTLTGAVSATHEN
jgi:hypothetical protein